MSKNKRLDETSYQGQYPYVQVMETESGHTIHYDDTPGHERILIAHASGSYTEMSADGKVTNFSVGDTKNYGKGGVSISVDENGDIKIQGHSRMIVGGGAHIEVAGDAGIAVGGDTSLVSMGNLNAHVDNIYLGAKGNMNMNIAGTTTIKSGGDINMNGANIKLNS